MYKNYRQINGNPDLERPYKFHHTLVNSLILSLSNYHQGLFEKKAFLTGWKGGDSRGPYSLGMKPPDTTLR